MKKEVYLEKKKYKVILDRSGQSNTVMTKMT